MKVYREGKEVKDAKVSYFGSGHPAGVVIDGVTYDPAAFEFKDEEPAKKTRTQKSQPKTAALTTEDLKK